MNKTILVWIGLGLLIGGCSLSPKYEQPKANLPQDFGVEYSNETISQTWWKDFGDEYLNGIVEEALKNNYDLAVAMERVSQARSSWGYARSDRYPSLSAQ